MIPFVDSNVFVRQAVAQFRRHIIWRSLAGVFFAELFVMFVLRWLKVPWGVWTNLLDAALLTVLIVPGIYWVVLKPVARLAVGLAGDSAEARFRAVVEAARDAIIVADSHGTIRFVNAATETLFGQKPRELTGQKLVALMPEGLREKHLAGLKRYLETGEAHVVGKGPVEFEAQRKDGTRFPVELTVNRFSMGHDEYFVGVVRDITQRKRIHMYESILPVCMICGKIRDDTGVEHGKGTWGELQDFVRKHSTAQLSHGLCPDCAAAWAKEAGLAQDALQ